MKTASMILGIIGGALAILAGIILILCGSFFGSNDFFGSFDFYGPFDSFYNSAFPQFIFTIYLVLGILGIVGGAAGLTGGILVKNKNTVAGVLLIIGAVLTFSILFILAAIFAFMKEKAPAPAYGYPPQYPPYPPQYAPYPPQYTPYPPQYPQYPPQQNPPSDNKPTDQNPQG